MIKKTKIMCVLIKNAQINGCRFILMMERENKMKITKNYKN